MEVLDHQVQHADVVDVMCRSQWLHYAGHASPDQADEPGIMTDIICQQFIHDPDLRQELLETEAVGARIPPICDYLSRAGEDPS